MIRCWILGHRYRSAVPRVFQFRVYCARCGRIFGECDAPYARKLWEQNRLVRRLMMGLDPE